MAFRFLQSIRLRLLLLLLLLSSPVHLSLQPPLPPGWRVHGRSEKYIDIDSIVYHQSVVSTQIYQSTYVNCQIRHTCQSNVHLKIQQKYKSKYKYKEKCKYKYKYKANIRFEGEGETAVVLYKSAKNLTVALGHVEGNF